MNDKKICAVILAAGYSSRMGDLKPILKVDGKTVLERITDTFKYGGITDIYVVLGYSADKILSNYAYKDEVNITINENFKEGMFSSVKHAATKIGKGFDAFFLTPADYPLINPITVRKMISQFEPSKMETVYPTYKGERGHPCLISTQLIDEILSWSGEMGLRGVLQKHEDKSHEIAVDDEGILLDMDTKQEYHHILSRINHSKKK